MCHPGAQEVAQKLNVGLAKLKSSGRMEELCNKYPDVKCELSDRTFSSELGGIDSVSATHSSATTFGIFVVIVGLFM